MMNMSIACNVIECKYNHKIEKYCTLGQINVCRNEAESEREVTYTDCASFEKDE